MPFPNNHQLSEKREIMGNGEGQTNSFQYPDPEPTLGQKLKALFAKFQDKVKNLGTNAKEVVELVRTGLTRNDSDKFTRLREIRDLFCEAIRKEFEICICVGEFPCAWCCIVPTRVEALEEYTIGDTQADEITLIYGTSVTRMQ